MRLRSEKVTRPDSWQPRPRRTRSASAQEKNVFESAPEAQPASETQPATQRKPAPKRKPAKKTSRKKSGAKGKKEAAPAAEPNTQTESHAGTQPDSITVLPSIEESESRRLPPPIPKHVVRNRITKRPSRAFPWSAVPIIKDEMSRRIRKALGGTPSPAPSLPKTPVMHYAWPPLPKGQLYDKLSRIPWSLPWTPPSPWRNFPRIIRPRPQPTTLEDVESPDESALTSTEEPTSRKRSRVSEDDDPAAKRHKLVLQTPNNMGNRPRGTPRRTYADRARRREAERNGRIDRTIYRTPQLLAQQGEDARSVYSTPIAQRPNAAPATDHNNVDSAATLPSALPPNQAQAGWIGEPQPAVDNDPSTRTPSSAPPSSAGSRSQFFTPRSHIDQSSPGSARTSRATQRKKYTYDLDPRGFDPALLARMRAGSSNPPQKPVPAQPEKVQEVQALEDGAPKKRKRQPSPDVIPHPPGCSYGFDPDYFIYDEDDEDDSTVGDQAGQDNKDTRATVSDASEDLSGQHVPKRVRFSKILPHKSDDKVFPENFNHQGHFQVPESDSPSASSDDSPQNTSKKDEWFPAEPHIPREFRGTIYEPMSRKSQLYIQARDYAKKHVERYMPKTPSRLRTALQASPQDQEALQKAQNALRRRRIGPNRRLPGTLTWQVVPSVQRDFAMGKACPSVDFRYTKWPEPEDWVSRLGFDKDLWVYVGMDQKLCEKMKGHMEETHKEFMRLLAKRRALRRRRRDIQKRRRDSASPPRAIEGTR
ncbi:uncharacterized protein N7515_004532 [Penicillium bovifimosum]|uniref:Uncharacterized protein n=1 Tax=Penicillium bovifimosum TaxID=126998 RepID=A0A9W9L437_9EURO|nr:uncharacterized protein N7515_004532 [Penicillium bovifimosum]KAJ5135254.1 hypothetical protein N7515_004532 [Penicillium bovifimosum]